MTKIPQRILGEAISLSAGRNPEKTALIYKGEQYSYAFFEKTALRLSWHLVNSGIRKGDRVAIYMHNSFQCAVSIYGATLAGAVFLVINPQTKAGKLQFILNDSGASILIAEATHEDEISQALMDSDSIQELIVTGKVEDDSIFSGIKLLHFEDIISGADLVADLPNVIPTDLAALIYTSGSTGFPKGVMMTHQSMVFTSWSLIQYLRLEEEDRILLLLPLSFDYGLYQLLMAITVGGTLIVEQSFTFPASVYKSIRQHEPTVFPGVPTIYAMMIASSRESGLSFPSVKKVTNTAAAMPADFIPELKKIFPNALLFPMYGLTECKRVCYLEPEMIDLKPNSVGKAIPGTEVFLLSPQGAPVPAGEPGILYVRGPHVMVGYWNREDLTNEMLKPGKIPREMVLCTNDWFRMDEEGFLYFQGRNDDIIKSRGEKISPVEIENIIYKIDGIREVAVFGLPDTILGESIMACVTIHKETQLSEKEIMKECIAHLELFMVPQKIAILDEMPKSANGKIDKKLLLSTFK
jgi:long-chain acyl-CoA synthetase